jgi:hypothetical protein
LRALKFQQRKNPVFYAFLIGKTTQQNYPPNGAIILQTVDIGAHPKNMAGVDRYKRVVFVNCVKNHLF